MLSTITPVELPELDEMRPARIEIDPGAVCARPGCGIPVAEHTGTPYTVDGFPVGSAQCADLLHRFRRGQAAILTTCRGCGVALSNTGAPLAEQCYWCATGTTPQELAATAHLFALGGAR